MLPTVPSDAEGYFIASGPAIDVAILGTELVKPLTLEFSSAPPPGKRGSLVSLHVADDGNWEFIPAEYQGGAMTVVSDDFSFKLPGWLNPKAWYEAVKEMFDSASYYISGRTDPGPCPPSGYRTNPEWATLLGPVSTAMHACLASTLEGPTGRERAGRESQIQSRHLPCSRAPRRFGTRPRLACPTRHADWGGRSVGSHRRSPLSRQGPNW